MSKNKRGKNLKRDGYKRGTCPNCQKKRVKLAWEFKQDGKSIKVCKVCNARILKGKTTLT